MKNDRPCYDCSKCPGYCCTYPLIEVSRADIQRLAGHFGVDCATAEERYTKFNTAENARSLRHRSDESFGMACQFLDQATRRCAVYEARPAACREYPYGKRCGYWEFLKFERAHQGDEHFVAMTR